MLAWQQERKLPSGLTLLLGAGIGSYRMTVDSAAMVPGNPLATREDKAAFDGLRGQVLVGLEKPLSDRLSIGATLRADHWSDQPRVQLDWSEPNCNPTLCEPPSRDGDFGLVTDPFTSMTFGVTLTLRP